MPILASGHLPEGELPPPPPDSGSEEEKSSGTTRRDYTPPYDFNWTTKLRTDLVTQIEKWADQFGVSKFVMDSFVRDNFDSALKYIRGKMTPSATVAFDLEEGVGTVTPSGPFQPETAQDWQQIWEHGLTYYSMMSGLDFTGQTGRGGGGGGRRKPSASEIRNMFDEDQLTDAVQNMWGAYLLEDAPNARSIAKQYIEAVVASGGEKEIDFQTYVRGRIEKTTRFKQVYRNKPEGVEPLKYIGPYTSMVDQVVGGGAGKKQLRGSLAAGGAALGASQDAFSQRLMRTDAVRNSTGFITGLEQRVRGLKNVLRG